MNVYVIVAAFLAASVEFVEALTIVLAVGTVRGFRPAMRGTFWAVLALAALILILGEGVLRIVPIDVLRGIIGALLLLFGLKWLRRVVLRLSGKNHCTMNNNAKESNVCNSLGRHLRGPGYCI